MAISTKAAPLQRRLAFGLILGIGVILALLLLSDLRQVSQTVIHFPWVLYPGVMALTLVNYSLRFIKWHYYLGQIGVRNLPWTESARLFVAGFPLAVTPGKVGEALKAVWLRNQTGAQLPWGIAVVLAERISDGLAVLMLSILGVIAYPRYWPGFALVAAGLAGVVVISQIRPLSLAILEWGERLPILGRFAHPLREFYEGSFLLFRPRTTFTAVSLGTISWLAEGIGFYILLLGLGLPASYEHLAVAVFVMAFSTVVGAASALPGGLGAAEASIAGMLIFLLKLSPAEAAAATLLIRFATLWFGVSLGLITWGLSKNIVTFQSMGEKG